MTPTTASSATVQTCVVHLIRNSIKYCSWKDRKAVTRALRPIYTAPSQAAASDALDTFEIEWGQHYPAIESLNYQLRKVTKTRGQFPTDDAVLKIFHLAIRDISSDRRGELGTNTQGWKQALNVISVTYPGRIDLNQK